MDAENTRSRTRLNFQQLPTDHHENHGRQLRCPSNEAVTAGSSRAVKKQFEGGSSSGHTEDREAQDASCAAELRCNHPASNWRLQFETSDLFCSPHISQGSRKSSRTPEIKCPLFPFCVFHKQGRAGGKIWDRFWITIGLSITVNLPAKPFWKHAKSFELKVLLMKCTGMLSYIEKSQSHFWIALGNTFETSYRGPPHRRKGKNLFI